MPRSILIVQFDDPPNALEKLFAAHGWTVSVGREWQDAFQALLEVRFDCVLVNCARSSMMHGEIFEKSRCMASRNIKFIILAASIDHSLEMFLNLDGVKVVLKPIRFEHLMKEIEK